MDVLTGLTLDNTSLPTGTVPSGDVEKSVVFEKVLDDELQQLQRDESAVNAAIILDADPLLMNAEFSAEAHPIDDPDSSNQGETDQASTDLAVLLTGQQQVIKTDAIPVAADTEYWLRDAAATMRHTVETPPPALPTMATVQESSGQSEGETGNSLPQRKAIELGALPHNVMTATVTSPAEEVLPETKAHDTAIVATRTDNAVATTIATSEVESFDKINVDTRQSEPGNTRTTNNKSDTAVATALQQASAPTVVSFVPKNTVPAQPVAPTPALNPIAVSSSLKADMAVAARVGDLGKWGAKGQASRDTSITDTSVNLTSTTQDIRSGETSIPAGLRLPFFNPRFNDVVSNQVLWMSKQGINQADIHLNPAELGPITVRLQQNGQETSVQFVVAHPATKEQLEQALPRLRDVFQHGGLQLINVDIQDGRKQPQHDQSHATASARGVTTNHSAVAASLAAPLTTQPEGLVDFYA